MSRQPRQVRRALSSSNNYAFKNIPRDIAGRDKDEFFIDKIVSHEDRTPRRSKTKPRKDCLYLTVRWLGQDVSGNIIEPWSNIKHTTQLWQYLHNQGDKFQKIIPKDKRRDGGIYHVMQ